jgi:F0F1-type ATP synthase membrane subunit b/b'
MAANDAKGDKDNNVEFGGHEFRRVKNGLDEAQVTSFINELISQRDILIQREEHLSSLTKLAEKTVAEADKLAENIKAESIDQAEVEAAAIIAKAKEEAQQMIEDKRTEIIGIANEQAAAIKAEAEREAVSLMENRKKSIQPELIEFVHQLHSQLISELENLKQQTVALEAVFERKLSQFVEETRTVPMEEDEIHAESQEPVQAIDQTSTSQPEEKVLVSADNLNTTPHEREPEFELEILPPIDITKIMGIVTYLDSLPEIKNTELIPLADKPSILVFLHEPIPLIDMLNTLPEVAEVKEDTTDTAGAEGKRKKVQIVLSEKTVSEEGKDQ